MKKTAETKSACPYCGVGCGVIIESDGQRITSVRGDPDHPANFGKLCSKGSTLHLTAHPGGRLVVPQLRERKDVAREYVSWSEAIEVVAARFANLIRTHGADSVALYGSGQLLTEDYYALNKLARAVIGTNNIDTNSRLCMSSAVAGYKATLGADAVPTCYEDIDHADLIFIAGANTAWAHPIVYRRIESAKIKNPRQRVVVVDPRRTETAALADLHLPILPGTDVALFHAMLHWWIWEERVADDFIARHTENFAALKRTVREMSPAAAARICGVSETDIVTAARWWVEAPKVLSLYCQGLNQSTSGTAKNAALIGLHLATAQIGKVGAGPFSLTGQPNAMGGREVGALANLLPGHREAANAEHRAQVAAHWNIPSLPESRGKTAMEMIDALESGEIKAVWITCTNPAHSWPDLPRVHAALAKAEFVVVQESFATSETLAFADVVLPATTWGEKSGTVTNSERRITRVRAALPPLGESKHDWQIFCAVGTALEKQLHPSRASVMAFDSTQALWEEHRMMTAGRDLDITGLSYATLDAQGPQQWPFAPGTVRGAEATRLYTDFRFATDSGKAIFSAVPYAGVAEKTSAKFPLALTTGRLRDQWHTMTRTGRSAKLLGHEGSPFVHMNPADLTRRGVSADALVRVSSIRGSLVVRAKADDDVRSGQAYLPMHWGRNVVRGENGLGINALTTSAFCPVSKQPELKHAAVKVEPVAFAWQLAAFVQAPTKQLDGIRLALLDACDGLQYACAAPIEDAVAGVWLEASNDQRPDDTRIAAIDALLSPTLATALQYDDVSTGHARRVWIENEKLISARLSGSTLSPTVVAWLKSLMLSNESVRPLSKWLLAPTPPSDGARPAGKTICTCFGISETAIANAMQSATGDAAQRVAVAQATLCCGTNCGSCVPELKRMASAIAREVKA
jgi:assimilatory nitrate reductase catalytic subunit